MYLTCSEQLGLHYYNIHFIALFCLNLQMVIYEQTKNN